MLRPGIFASVLGVLGGFLGVWLGIFVFEGEHASSTNFHSIVHDELRLSDEQEDAIAQLESEFATVRADYEADMVAARQRIGTALLRDHELSADVSTAAQEFHSAMRGLQLETLNHILAMRAELDPEQARTFDLRLAQEFDAARQ
jgi:nickel and cobalt resistance protein CnrR